MIFKKFRLHLLMAIMFVITASIALLFIATIDSPKSLMYVIASIFWLSLILGQIFFWKCNSERKQMERQLPRKRWRKSVPIGITTFFRNIEAIVVDMILFISAISIAILTIAKATSGWLTITSMTILFLSFNLHCILNGRNYRYLKLYREYKKIEKEQGKNE